MSKVNADLDAEREFQFVLSELERESALLDKRLERVEQVVAYYIAILTALIAAAALAASQTSDSTLYVLLLAACAVAAGTGHIAFLALNSLLERAIHSNSRVFVLREYFLDEFPAVKKYIVPKFVNMRAVWKKHYNKSTVVFLRAFAIFNAILLAIFGGGLVLLLLSWTGVFTETSSSILSAIAGIIVFVGSLYVQHWYLSRQLDRAKSKNDLLVDSLVNTEETFIEDPSSSDTDEQD